MSDIDIDQYINHEVALKPITVSTELIIWFSVFGNLQLALRHPGNTGNSRPIVQRFVDSLGQMLVAEGLLTTEGLRASQADDADFYRRRSN